MKLASGLVRSLTKLALLIIVPLALSPLGHAASFPCTTSTLILSAQNGNSGNPSTWVGGSVPGDGNCVVIRHHVTLNADLGTTGGAGMGWVRIENGGILDSDCASPHSISFGSAGLDPLGSGSWQNPGADASMFGIFVSFGSLNLSCAQPNNVTINSADQSHPWYIHHVSGDFIGCTAISDNVCNGSAGLNGAVLNLESAAATHLGTSVTWFNGIDWDMTTGRSPLNSLTISNSHLTDLYQIVASGSTLQSSNWRITTNWFDAPRPSPNAGLIDMISAPTNWVINDNTVTNPQTNSLLIFAAAGCHQLQVLRNAVLGSSTTPFALVQITGGTANTIQFNLGVNPEPPAAVRNPWIFVAGDNSDDSSTVSFNVLQGGHAGISQGGGSGAQFSPTFSFNWISQWKEDSGAQGAIITRSGIITETYNVLVMENSDGQQNGVGDLAYSDASGNCNATVQQDHNTSYGISDPSDNASINWMWGDGSTSPHTCVVATYVRSNIAYDANYGFYNNNSYNTWNLSQGVEYGGAAVHHNLTYGNTTGAYWNIQTSPGFDNGSIHHPNYQQYGDLTVNPQFLNPNRRPAGWDAQCGGPGTDESLFSNLARRSGFGGMLNPCYSIPSLWRWIRLGWAPLNTQLIGAGHDGTWIGAVAPVGNHP
jgi:hypothetical protein